MAEQQKLTAEPIDVADLRFDLRKPEPIRGFPELRWNGKRPFTSTQYYPAQLKEIHGPEVEGWRNKIYWGDNLQVMSHLLKEFRGRINLIYIDPPFDSKADYKKQVQMRGSNAVGDQSAFEEKQYTDIWTNDDYLQFMYERLVLMRELLSDNGSIYLHCDWHKSHYLRAILDDVFGITNLASELVWKRTSARSDSQGYNHIHDTIFFYVKTDQHIFNKQFTPYDQSYIDNFYRFVDEATGRRYRLGDLTAAGIRRGETGETWRGINPTSKGRHWMCPPDELDRLDAEGRIYWPKKEDGVPAFKRYLDEMVGVPLQSIWTDINPIAAQANENSNYPTQKPEALLERIIKASSNPGDIIFDCFMGSGTAQAVAMKLGRRFIGADINLGAIQTTTKRLINLSADLTPAQQTLEPQETKYTGFEVYNVNHYDVFRNPVQAKDLLLEALEIQRLDRNSIYEGEKDGRMVKIMPVNRIATRADLNELIAGFDYRLFEKRQQESPTKPVEKIFLVCMGHEPDLAAQLKKEVHPFIIDVEVVDILRDKSNLEFKREAEAKVILQDGQLVIERFYPMNLLQKLSLMKENVGDWRELVESVMVDWNYDGAVLQPVEVDLPGKNELVKGRYKVPEDAGTIRVKITDLLSESLEVEVENA